ncbi:hypothetical protein [Escherichia phage vB_EcoS_PHB17]|uniref:Single-stranded DNA-binding protein n=1 Tax=Escherichia phage vB_EcoS_PHB17 TaxID=2591407 RepID=A0A514DKT4_9CAUD|nr:hypothetical protein KMB84_gp56 [Escherichia phage vB_EcoS_PHB17]QDH94259.1 hypothetical protein [Escherichia phage vB_EcoS_PHB17]
MPHIITGELRKEPYTKEGQNNSGAYKMYIVELSESIKDRQTNERVYTNYSATFFASSDAMRGWYDEALQAGKVISVSSEALKINQREHNGQTYITLQMEQPRLVFSQRGAGSPHKSGQQQSQPQRQPSPQQNFDDDIPF